VTEASVHRAADGGLVRLEIDDDGAGIAGRPWFDHVRFLPRYGRRDTRSDFSGADIWGLDLAPLSSLGAGISSVRGRERERFFLAGGEVVVADAGEPAGARWAAWTGPWHLAHGMFYAPDWETADIVATFSRVRWVDTPEGLTAEPGEAFSFAAVMCRLLVAGIGSLRVESKRSASARVPRWQGARVPTGEVWQVPDRTGAARPSLLHVSDTAVTTLVPDAGAGQRAVDFLGSVRRLDWVA
jgi:hypothetical protein